MLSSWEGTEEPVGWSKDHRNKKYKGYLRYANKQKNCSGEENGEKSAQLSHEVRKAALGIISVYYMCMFDLIDAPGFILYFSTRPHQIVQIVYFRLLFTLLVANLLDLGFDAL